MQDILHFELTRGIILCGLWLVLSVCLSSPTKAKCGPQTIETWQVMAPSPPGVCQVVILSSLCCQVSSLCCQVVMISLLDCLVAANVDPFAAKVIQVSGAHCVCVCVYSLV